MRAPRHQGLYVDMHTSTCGLVNVDGCACAHTQIVDVNQDSAMDMSEFEIFGRSLGFEWDKSKFEQVYRRLDARNTGKLTFDEFYAW